MRVAPYSYDWLDNGGRKSPTTLIPGLDRPVVGQRWMTIFRLSAFEPDREVTLVIDEHRAVAVFGSVAITYRVIPQSPGRSRLVAKLAVRYPRAPHGSLGRLVLPPGDLVMMRRQLHTFRELSERDAARLTR